MSFAEQSYQKHQQRLNNLEQADFDVWWDKKSVDYWRHLRMYQLLDPILTEYPESSWLTVGDGKGKDANYLKTKGVNAVASDLTTEQLELAKAAGFIDQFQAQNAEKMSFPDNAFDFVFCKEAYHHFPRPMLALYEMLRVARIGVILLEPNDHNMQLMNRTPICLALKLLKRSFINKLKTLLKREHYYEFGGYEPIGNYIYSISEREIEKVALGLNYPFVVFSGVNDAYISGVELEKLYKHQTLYQQVSKTIQKGDKAVASGCAKHGLLLAGIFKQEIPSTIQIHLTQSGCRVIPLPRNPYL